MSALPQPEPMQLMDAASEMVAAKRVEGRSTNHLHRYTVILGRFVAWLESQHVPPTLDALTARNVRGFMAWTMDEYLYSNHIGSGRPRQLGPASLRHLMIDLKVFAKWVYEEELTETNQLARVHLPPKEHRELSIFTSEQLEALLSAAAADWRWFGLRNVALILTLIDSCARISELCSLTLDRLDLERAGGWGRALLWGSKTKRERPVYLSPRTVLALREYLTAATPYRRSDFVFIALSGPNAGGPINQNSALQLMRRLGEGAGISGVRCSPHTLRHTGATMYAREATNPMALQSLLGHTTLEMTRRYIHVANTDVERMVMSAPPVGQLAPAAGARGDAAVVAGIAAGYVQGTSVKQLAKQFRRPERTVRDIVRPLPRPRLGQAGYVELGAAAAMLGTTRKALMRRIEAGKIAGTKFGGVMHLSEDTVAGLRAGAGFRLSVRTA